LGRMLAAAARPLGIATTIVDPDPACPAAAVADSHIVAPFTDAAALRALAASVDVVTVEIEHVNAEELIALEAAGHAVHPSGRTVALIQDKLAQKQAMAAAGVPLGDFRPVDSPADIIAAAEVRCCSRWGGGGEGGGHVNRRRRS